MPLEEIRTDYAIDNKILLDNPQFLIIHLLFTAYSSWIKYTSSFPKGLREIFNMKTSNIGHYVKCLGLLEKPKVVLQDQNAPKAQASRNRLTYSERYE